MIDILVVLAYFCAIFGIGLYVGRKQESLESYALGNRNLPWWAILASILAAEISAATFLGAPGEGFALRNFTEEYVAEETIDVSIDSYPYAFVTRDYAVSSRFTVKKMHIVTHSIQGS